MLSCTLIVFPNQILKELFAINTCLYGNSEKFIKLEWSAPRSTFVTCQKFLIFDRKGAITLDIKKYLDYPPFVNPSHIDINICQMLCDASAADDFWKHCGKRRNCSIRVIFPFATMFSISKQSAAVLLYKGKGLWFIN